jgi:allantoinase
MLYDYWPITQRPPLEWPEGKGLAFWIGLNIEHFELGKPSTSIAPVTAGLPVDPMNHGWRDYGTRVGVWRLIELLDSLELRASVLLNSDVCAEYPQIVEAGNERGWAWLGHGKNNSNLWTGMELEQEREALAAMVAELRRGTGKDPKGWLGPALTETSNTPELLAEQGFTYVLDWCADDQPFPLNVEAGRMISLPYSVELNDITLFLGTGTQGADFAQLVSDQFEVLHAESKRRPGAVMALSLHPFLINQPFRHKYLAQVLEYVRGHDDVWFATSDEIADWYLERYYDGAVAALKAARG